jgi:hypothetical protein
MAGTDEGPIGIIDRLHLRGTLFERLIREPDGWAHPECFADSPGLMRFAMDLRLALAQEGWRPPTRP